MAYGNGRSLAKPRASAQTAGGSIMKFRHPYLTGQISGAVQVDEVDVSRCLRLNDTYLRADPAQDNAFMEYLVDGSTLTITNHLLAGHLTLQVIRTTGTVGKGDFIACAHLIIASKDSYLGTFTHIEDIDGERLVTVFYGVSFKNIPHLIKAGNSVVPYPCVMNYAGWVQGIAGANDSNEKVIWAVGNKLGIKAKYEQYAIQNGENASSFYEGNPVSGAIGGIDAADVDTADGDIATLAAVPSAADGISAGVTPSTVTWK